MKTAFLFPGQGAQYIGMGRELYEHSDIVRNRFDQADQILNEDFVDLIFHGSEEDIRKTENTQPGILMVSTAISELIWLRLQQEHCILHDRRTEPWRIQCSCCSRSHIL